MEIQKGIEIRDLALHLKPENILVISDLHIGFEEALNEQGILVPRFQFKDIRDRLKKVLDRKYELIIVNGDVKHEFGEISNQEWRETLKILDLLAQYASKIILIKGNHDTIIGPIAEKRKVEIKPHYKVRDLFIVHGHRLPKHVPKGVNTVIIGHEHPAVSLTEEERVERFKCFLKGKWKGKNLIVMPSYNPVVEGADILSEQLLSPFLQQNLDNFEVYIVEDYVYNFGKLKNIRKFT